VLRVSLEMFSEKASSSYAGSYIVALHMYCHNQKIIESRDQQSKLVRSSCEGRDLPAAVYQFR
jgi:hypothetical protein